MSETIHLQHLKDLWYVRFDGPCSEREIVRGAGLRFDGRAGAWVTTDAAVAERLADMPEVAASEAAIDALRAAQAARRFEDTHEPKIVLQSDRGGFFVRFPGPTPLSQAVKACGFRFDAGRWAPSEPAAVDRLLRNPDVGVAESAVPLLRDRLPEGIRVVDDPPQAVAPATRPGAGAIEDLTREASVAKSARYAGFKVQQRSETLGVSRQDLVSEGARMTDAQRRVARASVLQLAGDDPDRARTRNAIGFSQADHALGHALAGLPESAWTAEHYATAARIASRYPRQIGSDALAVLKGNVIEPPRDLNLSSLSRREAQAAADDERRAVSR